MEALAAYNRCFQLLELKEDEQTEQKREKEGLVLGG